MPWCFNNVCGRNCGCVGANACEVCGTWEEPETPDQGICHPYRVKRTCDAPELPGPGPCDDTEYTIVYNPDLTPPFRVISRLFDQDCEVITDEDDNPILTTSY
jgi:hypothetical protein